MDHVLLMSCVCHAFATASLWSTEGKGLTSWLFFCDIYCDFVTFQFGILGQVWYLIVSIPDPCYLSYFDKSKTTATRAEMKKKYKV